MEKACELGARAFQLLLTERSESMGGKRIQGHLDDSGGREARLEVRKMPLGPEGLD